MQQHDHRVEKQAELQGRASRRQAAPNDVVARKAREKLKFLAALLRNV